MIEVVDDLVEAVAREGEDEDQWFVAGAADGMVCVGRDVDRAARPYRLRVTLDLHLAPAADDAMGFPQVMMMTLETNGLRPAEPRRG